MGLVGIGVGYVTYNQMIKKNFSKVISIIAGIFSGVVGYLIVATIYFSNFN